MFGMIKMFRSGAVQFMFVATCPAVLHAQPSSFPPPSNLGDPAKLGLGIQRTMTLLETSTPERRNTVRILLYGQSITAGQWGVLLEKHLREKYPYANLIYQRLPLSGFATERLVRTAEADLYPSYADLVIFHDYGPNDDYETMIRKMREQTTAEIIIQADHLRRSEQLLAESNPESKKNDRQRYAADRNYRFLPQLALKYGCAFDGRRDLWKDYLREHGIESGELVKDDVHPNDHGTFVMTELIKAFLHRRSEIEIDPMNCGYVTTFQVGDELTPNGDSLRFRFEGNRVDVVFADDARGELEAMVDGRKPLDDPTMFYHGRNRVKWRDTPIPPGPWPPVLKMSFEKPLVEESWTLQAKQDLANPEVYEFTIRGSVTGDDGAGRSDQRFVSNSGRVVIEPADWDVRFSIVVLRRLDDLPTKFQLDWSTQTQATNKLSPPDASPGVERTVTVAQRLGDGKHSLVLRGDLNGIQAIRVYSPAKFPCPANAR
jgi:hypothetical protein